MTDQAQPHSTKNSQYKYPKATGMNDLNLQYNTVKNSFSGLYLKLEEFLMLVCIVNNFCEDNLKESCQNIIY